MKLPEIKGPWYLATVYTQHPDGIDVAMWDACDATAKLMKAKVPVFCPIAHTHFVATVGGIDHLAHDFWMAADEPLMDVCGGLLVCKMPNWERSRGIAREVQIFSKANKPIVYLEWPLN